MNYDFCDWLPASISGRVVITATPDCDADPNPQPVAGVTIQLVDASGKVLQSTTTDEQGNYQFSDLPPWVQYTVHEVQPNGLIENDADVGSIGGIAVGKDTLTQIDPGSGVVAVHYDFCLLAPASISGVVHIDTTGDCDTATNLPTLAGVTIDLLDSDGNVLETTVTNANGAYSFTNLVPGAYGVEAEQPNGYFSEDADTGTIDGVTVGVATSVDTTSQIVLNSGADGINYNFCVEPPGTISGYVFQDGPPITLPQGVTLTPAQVALYRNGVFQQSDKRLAGVTLYLGDETGQIVLDANLQPITAVTDANGFYQFTGLRAGTYTVLEQLPIRRSAEHDPRPDHGGHGRRRRPQRRRGHQPDDHSEPCHSGHFDGDRRDSAGHRREFGEQQFQRRRDAVAAAGHPAAPADSAAAAEPAAGHAALFAAAAIHAVGLAGCLVAADATAAI